MDLYSIEIYVKHPTPCLVLEESPPLPVTTSNPPTHDPHLVIIIIQVLISPAATTKKKKIGSCYASEYSFKWIKISVRFFLTHVEPQKELYHRGVMHCTTGKGEITLFLFFCPFGEAQGSCCLEAKMWRRTRYT